MKILGIILLLAITGCATAPQSGGGYYSSSPRFKAKISDGERTIDANGDVTSVSLDVEVTAMGDPFIIKTAYLHLEADDSLYSFSSNDEETWLTFNSDGWPEHWTVTATLNSGIGYFRSTSVEVEVKASDFGHDSYGMTAFSTVLYPTWEGQ